MVTRFNWGASNICRRAAFEQHKKQNAQRRERRRYAAHKIV
jgi:hypothetical protein